MKLLKEIAHEYAAMTRKNKCIPSTRKKGVRSKKEKSNTKKRVQFSKTNNAPVEPAEQVEEVGPVEPETEEPDEPVELEEPENPFESEPEEPKEEVDVLDDGLTKV